MSRQPKAKPPANETPKQKKARQGVERQVARSKPFESKESYRWVEALKAVDKQFQQVKKQFKEDKKQLEETLEAVEAIAQKTRIIHIFDREGDIAEVFDQVRQIEEAGVIVRAAHDRSLELDNSHLWEHLSSQSIKFYQQVELAETAKRKACTAYDAVRFCLVQLRVTKRLKNPDPIEVYAVYDVEMDPPEGEEAVAWMLLTTEPVTHEGQAVTILRWYTYRWRIEEYHKILKSGCQAESYRLAATSMEALLGFLTVIAAELLRVTYLHRTQPDAPATTVFSSLQLNVFKAKSAKLPQVLTVQWAVDGVARLGGYLEHRKEFTNWHSGSLERLLKLASMSEGWLLAGQN